MDRVPCCHVGLSFYSPAGVQGSDDVPSHMRRGRALHQALENVRGIEVTDWGASDASQPQWLVQLRVMLTLPLAIPVGNAERSEALRRALAGAGTTSDEVDGVVAFASHLRTLQAANDLGAFELDLPDGNRVRCEPRDFGAEFTVRSVTHEPVRVSDRASP